MCLASVNQETLLDGQERADLQIEGLGEKRITLSAYADAQEIYDELVFQFQSSQSLVVLSSCEYLREASSLT